MRYMGGKDKIARHFLPIILKDRRPDQYFVEPFCGGCNVTTKVEGLRIANDANKYMVGLYLALQKGWIPPKYVSFHDYQKMRATPDAYPKELIGFVGVACSFGGKFLDTFARDDRGLSMRKTTFNHSERCYALETGKRVLRDAIGIVGVLFTCADYRAIEIPPDSIVYCDPPYVGTSDYVEVKGFDSISFWAWVRNVSMYHRVYVSEMVAPKDFKSVWKKTRSDNMDAYRKGGREVTEHLFVWKHSPHIK